jgi:hypothetical protein
VESVKEAIWLLLEGPYSAVIGKGVVAQKLRVFLKKDFGGDRIVDVIVGANNQEFSR